MKRIFLFLIDIYKVMISPVFVFLFGRGCKFSPTCSDYAKEAISSHGVVKGVELSIKRVVRCHPVSKGGFDPVPGISHR